MTPIRLLRVAPLGLAAALALSLTAAQAQTPPAARPPQPGMHHPDGRMMREHMREHREEHRARMIADWTTVLKLSPSQAQALQEAMARPMRGEHRHGEGKPGEAAPGAGHETTLQRLDRMQARMTEREGRMHEHIAAMRGFYTSLSPDQQKSFDALSRLTHGGMRDYDGMGRHGGWGPAGPGGKGGPAAGRGMRHGSPPPAGD